MPAPENPIVHLADPDSTADLRTFLARARSVHDGDVSLVLRGAAMAVYVPVIVPQELGEPTPTILGMRAFRLAEPAEGTVVYPLGALTDRLARMSPIETALQLPPAQSRAAWAGILPPVSGWSEAGEYDEEALRAAAEAGTRAVVDALPENSGQPVLATVRSRIWSSPLGTGAVPELPSGAAFGAKTLGFISGDGTARILAQGPWHRLSTAAGHILVRRGAKL
ncbi:hypothetical protein [Zhihengliuella salsuginis]|uniref:Uncharacterized protein n=1 Tax=Zhihengliuella salsuginis TaxID=578222 RepID=A0ABQ3GEU0_9MICC|nr:hypothetical protein [Zhihengliuella salsuginis]GHD01773.1 hypothetical protein GCM10008096_06270 [Zhihengliuella salsuginis]